MEEIDYLWLEDVAKKIYVLKNGGYINDGELGLLELEMKAYTAFSGKNERREFVEKLVGHHWLKYLRGKYLKQTDDNKE